MRGACLERHGPFALVAGASRGLGLAFGLELARRGFSLLLVSENALELDGAKEAVKRAGAPDCRILVQDLLDVDAVERICRAADELEVGLVICNATYSDLGGFLERPLDDHLGVVAVNCRAPVALAHRFGTKMAERKKGGIVFMGSLTAFQGTPFIATYGASKAFNLTLGEALEYELKPAGIDVLVSAPGAVATSNYLQSLPPGTTHPVPLLRPETVAKITLNSLGRRSVVVPGRINRLLGLLMGRLLPRFTATALMGRNTKRLYGNRK